MVSTTQKQPARELIPLIAAEISALADGVPVGKLISDRMPPLPPQLEENETLPKRESAISGRSGAQFRSRKEERTAYLVHDESGKRRKKKSVSVRSIISARTMAIRSFEYFVGWRAETIALRLSQATEKRVTYVRAIDFERATIGKPAQSREHVEYLVPSRKAGSLTKVKLVRILRLRSLTKDGTNFFAVSSPKMRQIVRQRGYEVMGKRTQSPQAKPVIPVTRAAKIPLLSEPRNRLAEMPESYAPAVVPKEGEFSETREQLAELLAESRAMIRAGLSARELWDTADSILRGESIRAAAAWLGLPEYTLRRALRGLKPAKVN